MNTPILLIAWRRPHTLRQVADAISTVIERLDEAEKVAATRIVMA